MLLLTAAAIVLFVAELMVLKHVQTMCGPEAGRTKPRGDGLTDSSSSKARTPAAEVTVTAFATSAGDITAAAAICSEGKTQIPRSGLCGPGTPHDDGLHAGDWT